MSTQSWRKNSSVVEKLLDEPHTFSFFQAVRILERATQFESSTFPMGERLLHAKNTIAGFAPPATEVIRLHTNQSFVFPEAEIFSIEKRRGKNTTEEPVTRWHMHVNFMGLTGCMGVLPYHYTELILKRLKQKDETLAHFLNLFNHRSISLFYQASTKYHLPIEYERKKLNPGIKKQRDMQTQALLSLVGLGTEGLNKRLNVRDESLLFYSGLFTQQVRTSSGLKQLLQDYFDIPVKIQEFVGQWQELIPDIRTRMGRKGMPKEQNAQLGHSAMIGHKGWFAQGKIRISLGPLNREQFYKFAPATTALKALNDMVRMYLGIEHDYDFVIEVRRKDIPTKITLGKGASPIMGWNTWLSNTENPHADSEETLRITVSANRLK